MIYVFLAAIIAVGILMAYLLVENARLRNELKNAEDDVDWNV